MKDIFKMTDEEIELSKTLPSYLLELSSVMLSKNKRDFDCLRRLPRYQNMSDKEIRKEYADRYAKVFEVLSTINRHEITLLIQLRECNFPIGNLIGMIGSYKRYKKFIDDTKKGITPSEIITEQF